MRNNNSKIVTALIAAIVHAGRPCVLKAGKLLCTVHTLLTCRLGFLSFPQDGGAPLALKAFGALTAVQLALLPVAGMHTCIADLQKMLFTCQHM